MGGAGQGEAEGSDGLPCCRIAGPEAPPLKCLLEVQIYALLVSLSPCPILTLTHPLIHSFFACRSLHTHSLTIFLISSFVPSLSRFLPHSFPRFSLHSLLHRVFIALLIALLVASFSILPCSLSRSLPLSFILSSFPSSPYLFADPGICSLVSSLIVL